MPTQPSHIASCDELENCSAPLPFSGTHHIGFGYSNSVLA